jgi:cytochrome c oxidase assembly protein subunit 23
MASKDEPEETPWDAKTSAKFEKYWAPLIHNLTKSLSSSAADIADSKRPGEYFDPCQEAAARSLRCLHRNGGDREMCTDYFQYVTYHLLSVVL